MPGVERARHALHRCLEEMLGPEATGRLIELLPPVGSTGDATSPVVTIDAGRLRGKVVDGVASFKGIPYAAPPVGDLRWRPPRPATPWDGVRDCLDFANDCLQAPGEFEDIRTTTSEDCLFLNVWAPAYAGPGDDLPVMVWIHGGGYVGGGTSVPTYDATAFARRDIVAVTINYRLGRFGFFAHPAVVANAGDEPFGNYGLMDQAFALAWVQANVTAFGGDPGRVTIVGESAGGESVVHLLTSPAVEDGLFHAAMVLSGAGRQSLYWRPLDDGSLFNMAATDIDAAIGLRNGIRGSGPDALAALRALDADVLTGGQGLVELAKRRMFGGPIHGVPMVDGTVIVDEPHVRFSSGAHKAVPLVIGTTAIDAPARFPPDKVQPLAWFGEDEDAAREAYDVPAGRFIAPDRLVRLLLAIGADITMHEPAHFVASAMAAAGQPSWNYRFTYTAQSARPGLQGQVHAGELPWLFDTLDAVIGDDVMEEDRAMATMFHGAVANFVTTGDPNGPDLPTWPRLVPGTYDVMHFTLDDGAVFGPDPRPGVELVARAWARQSDVVT